MAIHQPPLFFGVYFCFAKLWKHGLVCIFFFLLLENLGLPNPALSLKTLIWLIFVPELIK